MNHCKLIWREVNNQMQMSLLMCSSSLNNTINFTMPNLSKTIINETEKKNVSSNQSNFSNFSPSPSEYKKFDSSQSVSKSPSSINDSSSFEEPSSIPLLVSQASPSLSLVSSQTGPSSSFFFESKISTFISPSSESPSQLLSPSPSPFKMNSGIIGSNNMPSPSEITSTFDLNPNTSQIEDIETILKNNNSDTNHEMPIEIHDNKIIIVVVSMTLGLIFFLLSLLILFLKRKRQGIVPCQNQASNQMTGKKYKKTEKNKERPRDYIIEILNNNEQKSKNKSEVEEQSQIEVNDENPPPLPARTGTEVRRLRLKKLLEISKRLRGLNKNIPEV